MEKSYKSQSHQFSPTSKGAVKVSPFFAHSSERECKLKRKTIVLCCFPKCLQVVLFFFFYWGGREEGGS